LFSGDRVELRRVSHPFRTPAIGRSSLPKDHIVSRAEQSRARQVSGGTTALGSASRGRRSDRVESAAFVVPRPPAAVVRRARLEALLDAGTQDPLTLVSAPAGTGKTVLVSSWAAGSDPARTVVWVSLRDATVGPATFWQLVTTGLDQSGVGLPPLRHAGPDGGDPSDTTSIAEAVRARRVPVVLVLDCDGVLTSEVTERLDALMRRAGGRLRVVLLTREDPLLPLHRYRLAGTVTELRMADLSFTRDEARELLAGLGVDLSENAMEALIGRTQGWAAGLRMAAMSLAHRADREEAARKLAGDTGTVAEYLLAEVLDTQPPGVRALLLDTSVVDILRPGLASALAGPHADRALSFLVHGNAFLEELREGVGCYRYHHLFRQLLRAQLAYESPARWGELHRAAASWFAAHDLVGAATEHAVVVEDWELAARYVVDGLAVVSVLTGRPGEGLHAALARLPRTADGTAVQIVTAARALASGDLKGAGVALRHAQESLRATTESWPAAELAAAVVELEVARRSADPQEAVAAAAAAQTLLRMQDPSRVAAHPEIDAMVRADLGAALVLDGRLDAAGHTLAAFADEGDSTGLEHVYVDALGQAALLAAWRGDLTRGVDLAVRSLRLSSAAGPTPAAAEVALAYVDIERYDVAGARRHAERAAACTPTSPDPLQSAMLALTRARILRAGGDLDGARRVLEDVRTGGLPAWLRDELHADRGDRQADLAGPVEVEVGVPRLAARTGPDGRSTVPTKVSDLLRSAAGKLRSGGEVSALRDLDHALRLAAPEQSRRAFREAPDELWQLLRRHDELWSRHAWLTEPRPAGDGRRIPQPRTAAREGEPSGDRPRIYEPLTEKEREVLAHLSELLTTDEIAAVMFISVNTVRTHVRNILRKLAASRRNEAVRRARDLNLILS
jgi:LuxR family maltose regulon positive regulatory protein